LSIQMLSASAAKSDTLITLRQRFSDARAQTLRLIEPLSAEDCALQSMPDASPAKWHLAHTSWFFETFVLERHVAGYVPFHPQFRMLFNSYYVSVGPRHPRPERGLLSRPALSEVLQYRRHVDACVSRLLDEAEGLTRILCDVMELGINHEQQHQELLLTDIKHLLSHNPLHPAYRATDCAVNECVSAPRDPWIAVPGGVRQVGHDGRGFAFDNELPRHRFYTDPFYIAARPVTNEHYLAFIADGGYRRPELWLSDGWDTCMAQDWEAPLYWQRDGSMWQVFTVSGMQPLEPSEPVCHVSYYEADAYARWAGARLPSEAEWEVFAASRPIRGNLLESGRYHPASPVVDAYADGAVQLFGDVWEWTQSAYGAYPGYRPAAGAVGEYNGKFMVNQYVLRGGSCATPRSHIRASYRNFFPPSARWQFTGVRLARDC
jgi:ergothioneine biosynthesis protein EgtB